jgi:hypothetical protein
MEKLLNETWSVHYWIRSVKQTNPSVLYWWAFLFGDSTYDSHIDNMVFDDGIGGFSRGFVLAFVVGLAVCVILLGIGAKKLRSG